MINIQTIKEKYQKDIKDRLLYISHFIKYIYSPLDYKKLCEIGAGDMELAKHLSNHYNFVDAFEIKYEEQNDPGISNLHIYKEFTKDVDIKKYNLVISICPYVLNADFDGNEPEEDVKNLLHLIVDMCINNEKDLFLVLANTYGSLEFLEEILQNEKYRNIIVDDIELHFMKEEDEEERIRSNKLLILKK